MKTNSYNHGMSSFAVKPPVVRAVQVHTSDETLRVELSDGRTVTAPIAWYPRLAHGTAKERNNCRLIGKGLGIHWPDLDEDISVANILSGSPSGESQRSLRKWLELRGHALVKEPPPSASQ